jgi:hypothetical protein
MDYIDQYVFSLDLGVGGGVPIYGLTTNEDIKTVMGGSSGGSVHANERLQSLYVPGGLVCKGDIEYVGDLIRNTTHGDDDEYGDDAKLYEYFTIPNEVVTDEQFDAIWKKMTVPIPSALRQKNKTQTNSVVHKRRRNKTVKR